VYLTVREGGRGGEEVRIWQLEKDVAAQIDVLSCVRLPLPEPCVDAPCPEVARLSVELCVTCYILCFSCDHGGPLDKCCCILSSPFTPFYARFNDCLCHGGLQVMDKMDDVRKKKIEEMVTEAISQAGGGGAAKAGGGVAGAHPTVSRTTSSASAAASSSRPGTARNSPRALAPKNGTRPPAAAAGAKGGAAAPRRTASGAGAKARGGSGGGGAVVEEDLSSGKLSNEELEERMVELFGGDTGGPGWDGCWCERGSVCAV
jgi:hypothetical protein